MLLERLNQQDVLLTVREAAELLRVSQVKMYRMLASGQIKGHKVGGSWRLYKTDLHAFALAQDRRRPHDE